MSAIKASATTLRICGDDLVPGDVTDLLGASPTYTCFKGEVGKHIVGPPFGDARIAKSGAWILDVPDCEPEDINGQIRGLFSRLPTDTAVWRELAKRYRINLTCGLFMENTNVGLSISTVSLATLSERGIELWFDIYAPLNDEQAAVS